MEFPQNEQFEQQVQLPKWVRWIGNMSAWTEFLRPKPWASFWVLIKLLNSFFSALGAVIFACNPITGLLIFAGMGVGNYLVALASILAGSASIIFNTVLKAPDRKICNGVLVFNSVLFAAVVTDSIPSALNIELGIAFWILLLVAVIFTNLVDLGLNYLTGFFRLPGLTIPSNVIAAFFFLVFRSTRDNGSDYIFPTLDVFQYEPLNLADDIDWSRVWQGVFMSLGQVYGVGNMISSSLIWAGALLYSPMLASLLFTGSIVGSFTGLVLGAPPYTDVYMGLWGLNGLMTSGALGYFLVQTPLGMVMSLIGALFATALQAAIQPFFANILMPVWSIPFNMAVIVILSTTLREESPVVTVQDKSFPELHLYLHYMSTKHPEKDTTPPSSVPTIIISEGDDGAIEHGDLDQNIGIDYDTESNSSQISETRRSSGSEDDDILGDDIIFSSKLSQTRNSTVFLSPIVFSKARHLAMKQHKLNNKI